MIDILYLTWNRREFTEASLKALAANTDWSLVSSFCFLDDCSSDGTHEFIYGLGDDPSWQATHFCFLKPNEHAGSPVKLMNSYIEHREFCAPIMCKLDNDVIVPPGWLNESLAVMKAYPEVDLLGIEPGVGPNPIFTRAQRSECAAPWAPLERSILRCEYIGGIGLMKRSAFEGRPLPPANGRFGFGYWQEHNPDLVKAWIAPGLPLFLLNRLPFEPWASLSARYIAEGWQRPWPEPYTEADSHMWEWWKP